MSLELLCPSVKISFPELILKGNRYLQLNGNQCNAKEDQCCDHALGFEAGLYCSGFVVMSLHY